MHKELTALIPESERQLSLAMTALLDGAVSDTIPSEGVHAWRLLRWEADMPLTDQQREQLRSIAAESLHMTGTTAVCFPAADEMVILLAATRFPARAHRDTALWLSLHLLQEQLSAALDQDAEVTISEEFELPETWRDQLQPMYDLSDWWARVSPMESAAARAHRHNLQTAIKRRQYAVLSGYVSRALRGETQLGKVCFAFVPLVVEAVWSQHADLSLEKLLETLPLQDMARRPRETLMAWLDSLQPCLRACPTPGNSAPIERVIASIQADCSLPYSQANLSRSLGLTPAYFCRLFHEKAGQHFSTFLTRTRMEKAQTLLADPQGRSLGDIAAACGYPNKSYFCQVFKKYTGMTPGEYEAAHARQGVEELPLS